MAELDLYQLLGVDGAVPVATRAHGLGQHHPGSVHSLTRDTWFPGLCY